ncbi:exo-alpha-sialidase, partial [bacterium]
MSKKVLMGSLLLILSVAVLASVVKKKPVLQDRNANTFRKIELINQVDQQNRYYERHLSRRTAVVDVPDATASKGKASASGDMLRRKRTVETAIPIADYYGDKVVQVGNAMPLDKITGSTIATSDYEYATAYFNRNIAMGSDGIVHAVWSDAGTPSNVVYYAKSTDKGETWSTPEVINDGYYGYKPTIDVDPSDPTKIHVAYIGYMNSGETRTARYVKSEDGGETWGASVLVAGSQVDTNNPDIVVDSQGNPHVAFDSYVDIFIRYNYSSDGGTTWMAEPEIVNTGFGEGTFGAAISLDNDGNPHVLFGGGGGGDTWGDKDVYWNWRDMASGEWQEIPPVQLSTGTSGTPYPSMVFDSNGIGHCFYDAQGTTVARSVWYRQYDPDVGWGDPVEFPTSVAGGYTMLAQAAIDDNDNLYVGYFDGLGGGMNLEPSEGDFFVGTNVSGEWQYTNVSGNGPNVYESHPNVARTVSSSDSLMHCLMGVGNAAPYNIVHEVGYPWPPNPKCGVNQLS